MPDITLDAVTLAKIGTNQLAEADNFTKLLYNPTTPPSTFDVINGQLTTTNLKAGITIKKESVQRGAFTRVSFTGATANLDYFNNWFRGVAWTENVDDPAYDIDNVFVAIPGASRTFYLPYATSYTWITWNICWSIGVSDDLLHAAVIKLYIDGIEVNKIRRQASDNYVGALSYTRYAIADKYWTGHHVVASMAAGWHTVSLRICMDAEGVNVPHVYDEGGAGFGGDPTVAYTCDEQTRVRVRAIRVIGFK